MIQETARWRIDPERVYVTGISAGGAMSVVLAATYPELFAAVGVHSAPPYRSATSPAGALAAMQGRAVQPPVEATATEAMPPMIVFHGTLDGTVRSVNAQRLADQWLAYYRHDARRHRADAARRSDGRGRRRRQPGETNDGPQPPRIPGQPVVCRWAEGARTVDRRRPGPRLVRWIENPGPTATPGDRGQAPRCGSSSARTDPRPPRWFAPAERTAA